MDTNLRDVVDGLELAEKVRAVRDYAKTAAENTWVAMFDLDNSITTDNRRCCAGQYARQKVLSMLLDDLVDPIKHQGSENIRDLYEEMLGRLPK